MERHCNFCFNYEFLSQFQGIVLLIVYSIEFSWLMKMWKCPSCSFTIWWLTWQRDLSRSHYFDQGWLSEVLLGTLLLDLENCCEIRCYAKMFKHNNGLTFPFMQFSVSNIFFRAILWREGGCSDRNCQKKIVNFPERLIFERFNSSAKKIVVCCSFRNSVRFLSTLLLFLGRFQKACVNFNIYLSRSSFFCVELNRLTHVSNSMLLLFGVFAWEGMLFLQYRRTLLGSSLSASHKKSLTMCASECFSFQVLTWSTIDNHGSRCLSSLFALIRLLLQTTCFTSNSTLTWLRRKTKVGELTWVELPVRSEDLVDCSLPTHSKIHPWTSCFVWSCICSLKSSKTSSFSWWGRFSHDVPCCWFQMSSLREIGDFWNFQSAFATSFCRKTFNLFVHSGWLFFFNFLWRKVTN